MWEKQYVNTVHEYLKSETFSLLNRDSNTRLWGLLFQFDDFKNI